MRFRCGFAAKAVVRTYRFPAHALIIRLAPRWSFLVFCPRRSGSAQQAAIGRAVIMGWPTRAQITPDGVRRHTLKHKLANHAYKGRVRADSPCAYHVYSQLSREGTRFRVKIV
jgi:hypothetical protein